MDFTLPEVAVLTQVPRFFKENGVDFVEISHIGSKDTLIKKVQPVHMAMYKAEWDTYCDGLPPQRRKGTPLTDLPAISEQRAEAYISKNVHTLDELAALSDSQCQSLGHGTLTDRENARKHIAKVKFEESTRIHDTVTRMQATIGPVPAEKYASESDLSAIKEQVSALAESMAALVKALSDKPKRGRPVKPKE